ncbi:MAG: hypothetical protein JXB10_05395 [Pirellulales bacterium]|nr:hypothetical protein [Pirellulales bacterium]
MLDDALGIDFGALEPSDNLLNANEEVDWADVFWGIEKEFQIVIPPERQEAFDGTFDALLQCIVSGRASEGK